MDHIERNISKMTSEQLREYLMTTLAESYHQDLSKKIKAGLRAARERGVKLGRPSKMRTPARDTG